MAFHQAIGVQYGGGLPTGLATTFPAPITEFRPRSPGSELSLEERELEELLFQTGVFILSGGKSLEQLRLEEQLALSGRSREIVRAQREPVVLRALPLVGIGLAAAGALVVWLLAR